MRSRKVRFVAAINPTAPLPTPLSPVIKTLASERAAYCSSSSTARIATLRPIREIGCASTIGQLTLDVDELYGAGKRFYIVRGRKCQAQLLFTVKRGS